MVTVYENISSSEKKNYQVVLLFLNLESTYLLILLLLYYHINPVINGELRTEYKWEGQILPWLLFSISHLFVQCLPDRPAV